MNEINVLTEAFESSETPTNISLAWQVFLQESNDSPKIIFGRDALNPIDLYSMWKFRKDSMNAGGIEILGCVDSIQNLKGQTGSVYMHVLVTDKYCCYVISDAGLKMIVSFFYLLS